MPSVLIIEDEEQIRILYKRLIGLHGYDVIEASDGEEGLNKAKASLPDLILLDIMLPKMGGIEVLRNLKKSEPTKNIPVVMLTNLDDDVVFDTAKQLGAADYLVKSEFTPEQVIENVDKHLK